MSSQSVPQTVSLQQSASGSSSMSESRNPYVPGSQSSSSPSQTSVAPGNRPGSESSQSSPPGQSIESCPSPSASPLTSQVVRQRRSASSHSCPARHGPSAAATHPSSS